MDLFGNEEIRALSWKEPFGTLMLHGKIETRTWSTGYRGLVLICTSLKPYNEMQVIGISGEVQAQRIFNMGLKETHGMAIAVARLVDCRRMTAADEEKCFVDYYPDLYCHVYAEVKPIKPFKWKGSQGWRRLTPEDIKQIQFL